MKAFLQECCVDAVYNNERSWWMTISRVTAGINVQVSRSMWVSSHNYDDLFERARNHWQEMQSVPLPLSLLYHNEQPQHPILLLHTHLISYIPVFLESQPFFSHVGHSPVRSHRYLTFQQHQCRPMDCDSGFPILE